MTATVSAAVVASASWADEISAHPGRAVAAAVVLGAAVVVAGAAMRVLNRRTPSLRAQVLAHHPRRPGARHHRGRRPGLADGPRRRRAGDGGLGPRHHLGLRGRASWSSPRRRSVATCDRSRAPSSGSSTATAPPAPGLARTDELGHVALAVDRLNTRLGELERERAELEEERTVLLSNISHDLRTPLAALRAAVEALADGVVDDVPRFYRSMERDVEALGALVDDLFLLVRMEDGRLDLDERSLDLAEVADEALEVLAPTAAARRVELELDTAGRVGATGDARALGRVVRNLVDNAIRHAPPGSTVRVEVSPDAGRIRP